MTHTVAAAVVLSFDVAIACFNILAGLLCFSAAANNYLLYNATLRIVVLMVLFAASGVTFIGIELAALGWRTTAVHVQQQVSHLNSYHGRALHFTLLALLACDSVEHFSLSSSSPLILWSWINAIALASLAFAFAVLALVTRFTSTSLLPRSMDVRRAARRKHGDHRIASGHTVIVGDEYDNDGSAELMIRSGLPISQRYSTTMEHAPSSTFLGGDRPLSAYSLTQGLGLDNVYSSPTMPMYDKSSLTTPPSSSAILGPSPFMSNDGIGTPSSFSTHLPTPNSNPTSPKPILSMSPHMQGQHLQTSDWVTIELKSTEEARFRDNARAFMNRTSTGSLSPEQHVRTHTVPFVPQADSALVESSYERAEEMQGSDCSDIAKSIHSTTSRRSRTSESARMAVAGPRLPSVSSTARGFAGIVRKSNGQGQRPSTASSFRYETTTDRMANTDTASVSNLPALLRTSTDHRASMYHRELQYDNEDNAESAVALRAAMPVPPTFLQRNRSRRRIFVPSIGRAIELSSGSESSDGEESDDEVTKMNTAQNAHIHVPYNDDDVDDDASVYSVQSAYETFTSIDAETMRLSAGLDSIAPLNITHMQPTTGSLGRRLTRRETRSVRSKLDRGIKRAMSQRMLSTNKEQVDQDPQSSTL